MGSFEALFSDRVLQGRGTFRTWCKDYEVLDLNFLLESGYPKILKDTLSQKNIVLRASTLAMDSHPEAWWLIDQIAEELKPTWVFLPIEEKKPYESNVSRLTQIRSRLSSPMGIFWNFSNDQSPIYNNLSKNYELPIYLKLPETVEFSNIDFKNVHFIEFEPFVTDDFKKRLKSHCDLLQISPVFVNGVDSSATLTFKDLFQTSMSLIEKKDLSSLLENLCSDPHFHELELLDQAAMWPKFLKLQGVDELWIEAADFEFILIQTLNEPTSAFKSVFTKIDRLEFDEKCVERHLEVPIRSLQFDYDLFFQKWRGFFRGPLKIEKREPVLLAISKGLDNRILFTELNEMMAYVLDLLAEGAMELECLRNKVSQIDGDFEATIDKLKSQYLIR